MKRITILAVILAVIVGGWTIAWFVVSGIIRDNVLALANADGQENPQLLCANLVTSGFPFWFDVSCDGLTVSQGDLTATVKAVKATVLVYDPFHLVAVATGPATLDDAFTGSKRRLDWKALEGSARLTGWRIARISVIADDPVLNNTVGSDVLVGKASRAEVHLLDIPEDHDPTKGLAGLALYAKADDINAPGLQINDGAETLEADITGLSDDVRTYGDLGAIRRWQAAGGKVKLVGFHGNDGPDNFTVTGTLGLDAQMRPEGQLTATSKGIIERLQGMIPPQVQSLVIGNKAADGSYTEVLNLTNGLILAGVVPLATVPPLL